jgi:hypothetical protein
MLEKNWESFLKGKKCPPLACKGLLLSPGGSFSPNAQRAMAARDTFWGLNLPGKNPQKFLLFFPHGF